MKVYRLGISSIGWCNDDDSKLDCGCSFEEILNQVVETGFSGTEIGNKYPSDWAELKYEMDLRGLKVFSNWFPTFFTSNSFDETVNSFKKRCEKLNYLGADNIMLSEQGNSIQAKQIPIIDGKPCYTEEEWKTVSKGFNELGKIASDYGLAVGIHHHMGTGIQTREEIDRIMDMTDPNYVGLTFDTGHLVYADVDVNKFIDDYIDRIKYVHLKDVRFHIKEQVKPNKWSFLDSVRAGVFTVPGDGDIDFTHVNTALKAKYKGNCILIEAEQDPILFDPVKNANIARKFLFDNYKM